MLILDYQIVIKNFIMAKKIKQTSQKSLKKTLLVQIEGKLTETLMEFPKKFSEKKYRKTIRKAGKILTNSIALKPVKATSKSEIKKSKEKKPEVKTEVKTEAVS
jgi:hypothetical protein